MRRRKAIALCVLLMFLVILVQSANGNLSAGRGFGAGVIIGAPASVFLSYSLFNSFDIQAWLGYFAERTYTGGALRLRLWDMRVFDVLLFTAMGASFAEDEMSLLGGWGGTVLEAGLDVEYSITRHLSFDVLVTSGIHTSPMGGFALFLGYGIGATYYF